MTKCHTNILTFCHFFYLIKLSIYYILYIGIDFVFIIANNLNIIYCMIYTYNNSIIYR